MRELRCATLVALVAGMIPVACRGMSPESDASETAPLGTAAQAVVNGSADTTHDAVVALTITAATTRRCSGTIVEVSGGVGTILTAAHCFDAATTKVSILVGPNVTTPTTTFLATSWASYPGTFDEDHDIAVVSFAAPGPLPTLPLVATSAYLGYGAATAFLAVGYGLTQGDAAPTLPAVSVRNRITLPFTRFFQTGVETRSTVGSICQGDSGGALIDTSGGTERLAAVNVAVSSCAANATNRAIGFYAPEISAWLRTKGIPVAPDGFLPNGAECTTDAICNSGACLHFRVNGGSSPDLDMCAPPSENLTACARNVQCASRFCDDQVCAACKTTGDCDGGACTDGRCPAPPRPVVPDGGADSGPATEAGASDPGPTTGPSGAPLPATNGDGGAPAAATPTAPPAEEGGCRASGSRDAGSGAFLALALAVGLVRRAQRKRHPWRPGTGSQR